MLYGIRSTFYPLLAYRLKFDANAHEMYLEQTYVP
jgi:hypothetical protein